MREESLKDFLQYYICKELIEGYQLYTGGNNSQKLQQFVSHLDVVLAEELKVDPSTYIKREFDLSPDWMAHRLEERGYIIGYINPFQVSALFHLEEALEGQFEHDKSDLTSKKILDTLCVEAKDEESTAEEKNIHRFHPEPMINNEFRVDSLPDYLIGKLSIPDGEHICISKMHFKYKMMYILSPNKVAKELVFHEEQLEYCSTVDARWLSDSCAVIHLAFQGNMLLYNNGSCVILDGLVHTPIIDLYGNYIEVSEEGGMETKIRLQYNKTTNRLIEIDELIFDDGIKLVYRIGKDIFFTDGGERGGRLHNVDKTALKDLINLLVEE